MQQPLHRVDEGAPIVVRATAEFPGVPKGTPIVVREEGRLDPVPNQYLLDFARAASAGRGSWRTVHSYAYAAQIVLDSLHLNGFTLETLTPAAVRTLADDWTRRTTSAAAHNLFVTVLRGMLHCAHQNGCALDPALVRLTKLETAAPSGPANSFLRSLRQSAPPPRPAAPSDQEVERLFAAFRDRRDRLIGGLALLVGLRRHEIAELPASAVEHALTESRTAGTARLVVAGKGRKIRKVGVPVRMLQALHKHALEEERRFQARNPEAKPVDAVFRSHTTGGRLAPETVGRVISDAASRAGIRLSTHALRRKFVSRWLRNHKPTSLRDLSDLRDAMGHARLKTLIDVYLVHDPDDDALATEIVEFGALEEVLR